MPLLVVGPDEIPIGMEVYTSHVAATQALNEWAKRYERQGYYSAANGERIALSELIDRCRIKETDGDAIQKECPLCGSSCEYRMMGRFEEKKRWCCSHCTWNEYDN